MTSMSKYLFHRNLRISKCLRSRVHLKEFYKIRFIRFGGMVIGGAFCFWAYYISKSHIYCNEEVHKYKQAIDKSLDLLRSLKDEVGTPGIVVGVSVDGNTVWKEGLGYSDIENRVLCTENTVMRIASISKSITMSAVAKLWEDGKLDLDKPVQEYVPSFPEKTYEGEKVSITCRHLVSHLSGIRHYDKNISKEQDNSEKMTKDKKEKKNKQRKNNDNQTEKTEEMDLKEYYIKDKFDNLEMSLNLFKDDPLAHKPGTKFLYTTHGWTLVSAIVEAVVKEPFEKYMCKLFREFGMMNTYLDVNDMIIYHRSRYYHKDKNGNLQNSPYVDNSYKWAGGGFLSTIGDLLKFGNIMLYSFQYKGEKEKVTSDIQSDRAIEDGIIVKTNPLLSNSKEAEETKVQDKFEKTETIVEENKQVDTVQHRLPGFLKHETIKMLWSPVENAGSKVVVDKTYGMGWQILSHKQCYGYCKGETFNALHTGAAVGASSVLLILPRNCKSSDVSECNWERPPQGIVIAIVTNLQSVNLSNVALEIAELFKERT